MSISRSGPHGQILQVYCEIQEPGFLKLPRGGRGSLEKWLILDLGHGKHKRSVPHLRVPESKEVLKKTRRMGCGKEHRTRTPKGPQVPRDRPGTTQKIAKYGITKSITALCCNLVLVTQCLVTVLDPQSTSVQSIEQTSTSPY